MVKKRGLPSPSDGLCHTSTVLRWKYEGLQFCFVNGETESQARNDSPKDTQRKAGLSVRLGFFPISHKKGSFLGFVPAFGKRG